MFSDSFAVEIRAPLQAQADLIRKASRSLKAIEHEFDQSALPSRALSDLESALAAVEKEASLLEIEDLADYDPAAVTRLYERQQAVELELNRLEYRNWTDFVGQTQTYTLTHGLDPLAPYDTLLADADFAQLKEETYETQYRWDGWDYAFVGTAGVLAALTDHMLVGIPQDMNRTILREKSRYFGQRGSPLTGWLQSYDVSAKAEGGGFVQDDAFATFARWCEARCKTPFDAQCLAGADGSLSIPGMNGHFHRVQSFGHDPSPLGFIVGVLDIMRCSVTGFAFDAATGVHTPFSAPAPGYASAAPTLIEAILKWFGHLISDVATPKGLPPPFFTLLQGLNVDLPGLRGRVDTAGRVARWMYDNGYDLRHFLGSGITPGVIEIVLRAYLMIRHYAEHGETKVVLAGNPKYRSMLLVAHGVAAASNAGKVALLKGNPLAINQAEWMAFVRYLVPHMKYWVFDRERLKLEHLDRITEQGWEQLTSNGRYILERVAGETWSDIDLGRQSAM